MISSPVTRSSFVFKIPLPSAPVAPVSPLMLPRDLVVPSLRVIVSVPSVSTVTSDIPTPSLPSVPSFPSLPTIFPRL